jgi:tetratricopeptide (TPR) repeat protein
VPWWYDERLASGDRFARVLRDRIDRCAAFIVVMSPSAHRSAYVAKEVRRALRGRRPIHPLLLSGDPLPAVADRHYVSVEGGLAPPPAFLDTLRVHIADPPPPASPARAMLVGRVPRQNPNFVGREALLQQLAEDLLWSPVAVQALHGTGGVGKTQLATEFAYRHRDDYDLIAWIDAENADLIPGQLADLAPPLGLPADSDATQTATQVLATLERIELTWLLVYDNAIRPHDLEPWLPRGGNPHGDVIITSRETQWSELATTLDIDVMTYDEAVALLKTRVPGIDESVAGEIVEYLGRLPLAVDLAGGFLATNHTPPHRYMQMLRSAGDEVTRLFDESQRVGYRHTIATVWEPTRADLEQANPAAAQLLRLCAFLAPEPVPLDLFTTHPETLPEPLASAAADPAAFESTVGQILRRSLARRDPDGLTLHRLLAATIRRTMTANEREAAVHVVCKLLYKFLPGEITDAPQNWPIWSSILPHVLAATDTKVTHRGKHDRTSWLLDRAAIFQKTHGQARAAQPLLERALRIDEATYGPDHPTVAVRLSNLATVLQDLGHPEKAQPLLERALRIGEATHGPDHPTVAVRLSNLALVLQDLGHPEKAQPLLERALRIDEATHGPDHPTVATTLSNLATVLQDLGHPEKAQPLLERALRIDETTYGPDHPAVATRLSNLALVLKDLGQAEAARPLLERALRINETTYGPDHPAVAIRLSNLALVLKDLNQAEAARPLLERALRIDEATYGPDHPTVAIRLSNLALVLQDLNQAEAARPLLERALRIDEATYGPDHPTVAIRLSNLATVLHDLDQAEAARSLLERALRIDEATYGPDHPTVATTLSNLATVLKVLGHPEKAQPLLERALRIKKGQPQPPTSLEDEAAPELPREPGLAKQAGDSRTWRLHP